MTDPFHCRRFGNGKGENVSAAQVILRWLTQRGIFVIPKTVSEERLKENRNSLFINLSEEQIKQIDSLNVNKRYILGWVKNQFD